MVRRIVEITDEQDREIVQCASLYNETPEQYLNRIVQTAISESNNENIENSASGREEILHEDARDFMNRFAGIISEEKGSRLPRDLAANHDHYLYGAPKVQ